MQLYKRIILKLMSLGYFDWLPDELYLKWKFKLRLGYKLNLAHPKTFNEKLNWLKLYDFRPEYTNYVDKYAVRKYITQTIGAEYLIPLIGVYNSVDEIPWNTLPEQFVLKCTTGSGGNYICLDKNNLNIGKIKKKLHPFLRKNYFYLNREYPYKNIVPKIVCEQFISETNNTPNDYKVYCCNSKAKLLEFHIDRFGETTHTCDYYDEHLDRLNFTWGTTASNTELPYSDLAEKIVQMSEKISKQFIQARIDWYVVQNKIYFGEITLYNGGGFEKFDSYEDDLLLGTWIKLPLDERNR